MKRYRLDGWQISGYYPYVPQLGRTDPRLGRSITDWIPAQVPGSVHADLWRAGWIEDPYFGFNSLRCEWVENKWWAYRTQFTIPRMPGRRYRLCMDGLDYKCRIYLNDAFVHLHEGSFTPCRLDVTDLLQDDENQLLIVFESAPAEDSQAGHTTHTHTQKSRFSYKWDFSTRMVPVGIWDEIWIEETGEAWITDVWLKPERKQGRGKVTLQAGCAFAGQAETDAFRLEMQLWDGDRLVAQASEPFAVRNGPAQAELALWVEDPKPWQPNGMGEQPLYRVQLQLYTEQGLSHTWTGRIGFCDLKWVRNEGAPEESLPYCLQVDGRRVYLKGVNLTPFDMLIGTVSRERYRSYLQQIRAANINLVRVNGVGLIEKEWFYDLCDEYGILVWQEFIQTSSSMDRMPPQDPAYLQRLVDTSGAAIRKKRNHVCLACYCGGNELTNAPGRPATAENGNIRVLQQLVDRYDTGRMLFPSSASGPKEFLTFGGQAQSHDVHGPWNYEGVERHYALFNQSGSLLHGELGAEGMADVDSLRRFLPQEHLRVVSMQQDLVWRHHGDWWDTFFRDREIFGQTDDLQTFVNGSQLIQAEAIRYALESNRRRKYHNSGSMMWAFNEPFPNVSNTCLVDYYGVAKPAYYALRDAYSPLHISMRYDKLYCEPGQVFAGELWINNSLQACAVNWRVQLLGMDGRTLWQTDGTQDVPANASVRMGTIAAPVTQAFPAVFLVRLSWAPAGSGQEPCSNEYLFGTRKERPLQALYEKAAPQLQWQAEAGGVSRAEGAETCRYTVTNTGAAAALYVEPYLPGHNEFVFADRAYSCLMPGESRRFCVTAWQTGKDWRSLQFRALF